MLAKLALGNIRKSLRDYAVYFVTIVLGVAVFYAFNTISGQADFLSTSTNQLIQALGDIIGGLTVFLACVLGFLMVYANNYLVRRRKRELGLYQVLGMRRGQVSAVLTLETFIAGIASFAVGLLLGILLSQVLVFVTAALFQERVTYFSFKFSPYSLGLTAACFAVMFAVMLLFNLRAIRKVRLVDLMVSERTNEDIKIRNMPLAVCLFLAGCGLIGWAYARLLNDGIPFDMDGQKGIQFLITTIMVVAGTFMFFYALSGFLLSLVRRMRRVYWSGLNMFTLRQLNARINTASVSMAVISLILFLAITSVTGGMSICSTLNDNLKERTPYDASVNVVYLGGRMDVPADDAGTELSGYRAATTDHDLAAMLADAGHDLGSAADYVQVDLKLATNLSDDSDQLTLHSMSQKTGVEIPAGMRNSISDTSGLDLVSVSDFNALRAFLGLGPIEVAPGEYVIATDMGEDLASFYSSVMAAGFTFDAAGQALSPSALGVIVDQSASLMNSPMGSNTGIAIVSDEVAALGVPYLSYINLRYLGTTEAGDEYVEELTGIDTSGIFVEDGEQFAFINNAITATDCFKSSAGMTGIVSYMAIYIGFVLVISCAAILAIQQLSEASDSQGRYRLLSELGAPTRLVYRSVLVQALVYFLFPLAVGLAHSLVALAVVTDLVALFGHLNITGAAMACGGLFVVVYGGYLLVTYRVARGVARQAMVGAHRAQVTGPRRRVRRAW